MEAPHFRETTAIPKCFHLAQTLDCGQAFRWRPADPQGLVWEGAAKDRYLRLEDRGETLALSCSQEELEDFWSGYFDLETDYEEKRRALSGMSPALAQAAAFAPGIRILRQDPWEALCSFLISQNNHIPRIKGIIERLCQLLGEPIGDTGWHSFPGPEKLSACSLEDLAPSAGGVSGQVPAGRRQEGGGRGGGPGPGGPLPGGRGPGGAAEDPRGGAQGGGVRPALRLSQDGVLPPGRVDEAGHGIAPPRHGPQSLWQQRRPGPAVPVPLLPPSQHRGAVDAPPGNLWCPLVSPAGGRVRCCPRAGRRDGGGLSIAYPLAGTTRLPLWGSCRRR